MMFLMGLVIGYVAAKYIDRDFLKKIYDKFKKFLGK